MSGIGNITAIKQKHITLIKEKEAAEKNSALSTHLLQDIVSAVPGNLYWKNKNGVWLGCNEYTVKTLGATSKSDIIGKTDYEIWPDQADIIRKNDQQVMASGNALRIEETVVLPTGEKRSYAVIKMPFRDEHGHIIGIIGNSLDITELKQTQTELLQAKEKAEVANVLKTEFMENMQHDMRTPAAGIYQMLEMLSNTNNHDKLMELIPLAASAAKELLNLCNEVIDFENPDYGKHAIAYKSINIQDTSSRIIALNSATAKHKNIHLYLDIDKKLPTLLQGDEYRLKKILTNLVGNSLKFTKTGTIKLAINLLEINENIAQIEFDISDTGIGIPEDKINLIFDKFIRLNPSNKGIYKGSGLGLSKVKKYVNELNGNIKVESTVNVGSRFRVTLPFILENVHTQTKPMKINQCSDSTCKNIPKSDSSSILNSKELASHTNINADILLIEDNPLARLTTKNILEKSGHSLEMAIDVTEAKKNLDAHKFRLIISDLGLPDGTGFDIIHYVKNSKNSLNYSTPFILLTAHNNETKQNEAKKHNFSAIFEKPLTAELAQMIIDTYLNEDI